MNALEKALKESEAVALEEKLELNGKMDDTDRAILFFLHTLAILQEINPRTKETAKMSFCLYCSKIKVNPIRVVIEFQKEIQMHENNHDEGLN